MYKYKVWQSVNCCTSNYSEKEAYIILISKKKTNKQSLSVSRKCMKGNLKLNFLNAVKKLLTFQKILQEFSIIICGRRICDLFVFTVEQ